MRVRANEVIEVSMARSDTRAKEVWKLTNRQVGDEYIPFDKKSRVTTFQSSCICGRCLRARHTIHDWIEIQTHIEWDSNDLELEREIKMCNFIWTWIEYGKKRI